MIRILLIIFSFLQVALTFAQNPDAALVYQETNISVRDGRLFKTLAFEIKIYDRAGEKYTKISIPYSKLVKVSKIEAYLKDKNGSIIKKLEKSDLTEKSAISDFSFYEDNFIKEFTLKHNSYPYSIYYSYQVQEDEFFFIDYWLPVIERNIPTLKARLNIEIPLDYKILFTDQAIDSFSTDTADLKIKYTWTASYKDIIEPELFAPPVDNFMPHVIIVPQKFKYFTEGACNDWLAFGNWQFELLQGISDLTQYEKNIISDLIKGVNDKEEQIKILYHYLQDQTRYINITIETGGLKPYPASYVAQNKYGDCKALTNYFKSILEAIGIKSYYTIVNAGTPTVKINKNFPSQQFNHVILFVPLQDDTIWLDCTSDRAFNHLGTFTQDRDVFVIDKNKSYFTSSPALCRDDVLETRTASFSQAVPTGALAIFSNTYKGEKYEWLYELSHLFSESEKSQFIRNYFIEDGFEVADFRLVEAGRDIPEITLSYSAYSNKVYNTYGNEILIKLIPFSVPHFEEPEKRKMPVQLDFPIYKSDTLEYEIPDYYSVPDSLKSQSVVSEFGRYSITFNQKSNKVKVIKSFLLNPGYYAKDEYENFYDFIHKINEIETNTFIITTRQE